MQQYTQFSLIAFDRVAFAHALAAPDYSFQLENQGYSIYGPTPEQGGVLEIGFVEENPLILTTGQGTFTIPENAIFVLPPNLAFSVKAQTPGLHRHTTAEFLVQCSCAPAQDYIPPRDQTFTLPLVIPPSQESGEVFAIIRSFANARTARVQRSWFEECADFMALICKLCTLLENSAADAVSPGSRRYCQRAKTYIAENIHRRLTVGEVAQAVGVSKNYMTNLFSACEGIPLTEYMGRRKLGYMVELTLRYGYTLAQAAEQVGYTDVNYVSRIFRRYYGMSFSEFRKAQKKE